MFDLERLLSDIERAILSVADLAAEGGGRTEEVRRYGPGGEVEVRTSVRVGFLDEMRPPPETHPALEEGPMVDVIQTEDSLKVLVLLPGVKKDHVKVFAGQRSLDFEINTRGRTYRRRVPCGSRPSEISIQSMVENNSVVEITFARKEKPVRR